MRSVKRPPRVLSALGLSVVLSAPVLLGLSSCATTYGAQGSVREIEMAHDDGRAGDRPILPSGDFELLVKNEPQLPSYRPLRLRFLVGQPGRLQFHLYEHDAKANRPGKLLYTVSGAYSPAMTSSGKDGKWVVETLPELPAMNGPIWLGIGVPDSSSEARVWASQNDSGHVYQRDTEPGTALISTPVRYTPMVRLVLQTE